MNRKNSKLEAAMERERKESQVFRFSTFSQQHFALVPGLRANQQEKHRRTHDLIFVLFDSLCVCNFCFQGHCLKQLCTFQCAQADPKKQIFTLEKCDLETFDHYYEKTSPGQ